MPILTLLALLMIYVVIMIYESSEPKDRVLTSEEMKELTWKLRGKSQNEARKIIRDYKKRR